MQSITFTCETITPMFLAGADGVTPELRAPSIKGALRFWWRAMNGHSFSSVEAMKEAEGKIFGDTKQRSKVIIRVKLIQGELKLNKMAFDNSNIHILNYMSYGTWSSKADEARGYFQEGTVFEVKISYNLEQECATQIIDAFKALSFYGGLGMKSRNGFGSFNIKEKNMESVVSFLPSNPNSKQPYHAFSSESTFFITTNNNSSWQEVITLLGGHYKENSKIKWNKISNTDRHAKSYFMSIGKVDKIYFGTLLILPHNEQGLKRNSDYTQNINKFAAISKTKIK